MKVLIDLNTLKKNPTGAVSIRMQGPTRLIRKTWWTHMGRSWDEHAQAGPNGEWLPTLIYEVWSKTPDRCTIIREIEYLEVTDERPAPIWTYKYMPLKLVCAECCDQITIVYETPHTSAEVVNCMGCGALKIVPGNEFETVEEALARLPKP